MTAIVSARKSALKSFFTSWYFPLIAYAVFMAIFHFCLRLQSGGVRIGDDEYYSSVLAGDPSFATYLNFMKFHYEQWSSRMVIETLLILIVHTPVLWRILNTVCMVWIACALSRFFNPQKHVSVNWVIVCAMMCYPLDSMRTAGWIATTLNYMWPLAAGLFAMVPLHNAYTQKRTPWYIYPPAFLATIYAVNQEQMCAVILAFFALFAVLLFGRDKRIPWYALSGIIVSVASLIVIAVCPGNDMRNNAETVVRFPQFEHFSVFRKAFMGYLSTLNEYIATPQLIFTVLCIVLMTAMFLRTKNHWLRALSTLPLIGVSVLGLIIQNFFPDWAARMTVLFPTERTMSAGIHLTWVPTIIMTVIALIVIGCIWYVLPDKKTALFAEFTLAVGFACRAVMGFSPTIWASSTRTFLFTSVALIAVIAVVYRDAVATVKKPTAWRIVMGVLFTVVAVYVTFNIHFYFVVFC